MHWQTRQGRMSIEIVEQNEKKPEGLDDTKKKLLCVCEKSPRMPLNLINPQRITNFTTIVYLSFHTLLTLFASPVSEILELHEFALLVCVI